MFKKRVEPVKTGGSVNVSGFRPLSRALELDAIGTWGLRPRSIFKKRFEPVKTGGSVSVSGFRPLSRALELDAIGTWACAPGFMLTPASQAKTRTETFRAKPVQPLVCRFSLVVVWEPG